MNPKEKFTIIRLDSKGGTLSEPARPSSLSLDVADLDGYEVMQVQDDPSLTAAPELPFQLIKPHGRQSAADAGARAGGDDVTWGVRAVGADKTGYTGKGVTVAVLDSGIDGAHPEFAHLGERLTEKDFTGSGNGDKDGHGTHCAGTIFGHRDGHRRIGIAPGIERALVGKVFDGTGAGTERIARAIHWAAQEKSHVISMSLGFDFPGYVARLAFEGLSVDIAASRGLAAYRNNVRLFDTLVRHLDAVARIDHPSLLVAAGGNESRRNVDSRFEVAVSPPASADGVISVGALQEVDGKFAVASFSNTGPLVSAPGVGIYSASLGGGYEVMSGTSMAAPHVAGVTALWVEQEIKTTGRTLTGYVRGKVLSSARRENIAAGIELGDIGAGIVQAPPD